ncbi:MAG: signal peptidase I [Bacteroidia bacterium]
MQILKKYITKTLVAALLTGVFLFLFGKFFLIDVVKVTSLSMSPTLKPNTWHWVKPFTFLSSKIKRNDVVQLSLPADEKDTTLRNGLFFKRIIGLPGDTILIYQSQIYINGEAAEINKDLLHNYVIKLNLQKDTVQFENTGIDEKYLIDDSCAYMVMLTRTNFHEIIRKGINIKVFREDSGLYDDAIFPFEPSIKWNKDFFGPIYIPKKNDTLILDTSNIVLYRQLISVHEQNRLELKEGKIFINQKESTYYVIRQNYYFAIGDNFDNSIDSRNWGFIPEKAIRSKLIRYPFVF